MSSQTGSPYQSKLFNFLNRQSLRWRERLGTAARHLKVTAEWGVQVMLYPIYLLVQAGRMAGQELQQVVTHAQLPAARADVPSLDRASDCAIVQVLTLLPNEPDTAIRGIASVYDSRRLALVTADNSLLDILSDEQERRLVAHIRTEVANYWYSRRLAQAETQKLPAAIPDFAGEAGDKVLPPARFFWKVMVWVQRSPLAIATNLFGESRFTNLPGGVGEPDSASLLPSEAFISTLDSRIAEVETAPLATANRLFQQVGQQLQAIVQQHLQPLGAKAASAAPIQETAGNLRENADPFAIRALILAAVDYFFGQRTGEAGIGSSQPAARGGFSGKKNPASLEGESSNDFSLLAAVPKSEEPWLSWEDMFGKLPVPAAVTANVTVPELPPSLPNSLPVPTTPNTLGLKEVFGHRQRSRNGINRRIKCRETDATPVCAPPSAAEVVPVAEIPNSLETAFDWLEAEVTSAGYVKHPLEQVLEWLDRLILWLEQLLTKLWKSWER